MHAPENRAATEAVSAAVLPSQKIPASPLPVITPQKRTIEVALQSRSAPAAAEQQFARKSEAKNVI
jgi:hypothetical protein